LQSKILRNGKTLIAYAGPLSDHALQTQDALLKMGVELIHLPNQNGKVDLPELLRYLATVHQANEIHVEAGSKLNGSLIRENCVDELLMYLAPKLLGQGFSLTNLGPLFDIPERDEWEWLEQKVIDRDLRLRLIKSR
jgi:diaminohydroxyphosphoribosylaminopyrimidine deaminase/5-amino-6-(5-phosphoribosylamino)uracil reductase